MATQVVKGNAEIAVQIPPGGKWVDQLNLNTPNTAETYTVPAKATTGYQAVQIDLYFTDDSGKVYARFDGGTALAPAADKTDGTGSTRILQGRAITADAGATISFVCDVAQIVIFEIRGAFLS